MDKQKRVTVAVMIGFGATVLLMMAAVLVLSAQHDSQAAFSRALDFGWHIAGISLIPQGIVCAVRGARE